MRQALGSDVPSLDAEQQQRLSGALAEAEEATVRYHRLLTRGNARKAALAPLAVAAGGVALDDVTGVGVGDDVLLPFIGLAMLVAYCQTHAPARDSELAAAWQDVVARLEALARVVDQIRARAARWTCAAQCNVQAIPGKAPATFPERVFGRGDGPSEMVACENAKRAATQSAPAGTYPRHCRCECHKY